MIEQDPRNGIEAVGLAEIHREPVAVTLRDPVGTPRVKPRVLILRGFFHLSEHLGRGRLVEADLRVHDADRFEHPGHAERRELPGQHGLAERGGHEGLRREVVDLVGLRVRDGVDQRVLVEQVPVNDLHPIGQVPDGDFLRIAEVDDLPDRLRLGDELQQCVDDVGDVRERARLCAITENRDRLTGKRLPAAMLRHLRSARPQR